MTIYNDNGTCAWNQAMQSGTRNLSKQVGGNQASWLSGLG